MSFYYVNQLTRSECLLHSEDIVSLGPRSLKLRENSVYMRRVKCLDGESGGIVNIYIQLYRSVYSYPSAGLLHAR